MFDRDQIEQEDDVIYAAENGTKYGDYLYYEVNSDDTVTITDCDQEAQGSIEIPSEIEGKRVTGIGDWAFYSCKNLENITLPNSVASIGKSAFRYCNALTGIYVDAANQSYCDEDGVLYSKDKTKLICYPAGKTDASFTVADGVTEVGYQAFYGCKKLENITLPNSVTSIGGYALARV